GGLFAVFEIDRIDDRLAAIKLQRRFEHAELGAVDRERRRNPAAHAPDRLGHIGGLVAADIGGAEIDRVRAFLDLLARRLDAAVPIAAFLISAEALRAIGVAALADREIGALLPQRRLGVERGDGRNPNGAQAFDARPRAFAGEPC